MELNDLPPQFVRLMYEAQERFDEYVKKTHPPKKGYRVRGNNNRKRTNGRK